MIPTQAQKAPPLCLFLYFPGSCDMMGKRTASGSPEGGMAMGFWIFMLVTDLLIPVTMIGFGRYFMRRAPKDINPLFGYRTTMSMRSRDTWEFAHRFCGRLWYVWGLILLPVSAAVLLLVPGKSQDCIGTAGGILCMVQLAAMMGAILPTEIALRKHFGKDGKPR